MLNLPDPPPLRSVSIVPPRAAVKLRAMLFAAGHEHRQPPERYHWDGRQRGDAEFALIQLTLEGSGRLEFDGSTWTVGPGDAMMLWFPHEHRYWRPPNAHWRFLYACLQGSEAVRLWRDAAMRRGPIWRLTPDSRLIQTLHATCHEALAGRLNQPYAASAWAYRLAMHALEESVVQAPGPRGATRSMAVARAVRLAQTAHRRPIAVDDLASAAGMSRAHFSRVFRQSEGVSPARYLRDLRLATAIRLLQTTDRTLEDIAHAAGFTHASHLSRTVRRTYDATPGSIRRAGMYDTAGPQDWTEPI